MAGQLAMQLQKAQTELAANENQLQMHEGAYQNNLLKIQKANKDIVKVREKIRQYNAELKMSAAEAEIAQISESFDMNVTTNFGEIEYGDSAEDRQQSRPRARRERHVVEGHRGDQGRRSRREGDGRGSSVEVRGAARAQVAGDDARGGDREESRTGGTENELSKQLSPSAISRIAISDWWLTAVS